MQRLEQFFGIEKAGSTVPREVLGGFTTFATMSYIVFVQPAVLSIAGMPHGGVLLATCISSAIACFLMGFIARYPFALAPGMGENFFFAFTIVITMKFSWQAGLAMVFIAGLLFVATSFIGVREKLMRILPDCLKNAIGPGIGLFIALIGLQWGGIVCTNPATMIGLGDLSSPVAAITVLSVFITAGLLAHGIRFGILVGIGLSMLLLYLTGILHWPETAIDWSTETFFALNFSELAGKWQQALIAIALLFFVDMFDTIGTLIGVGKQAGFVKEDGTLPRAGQAFFCDAVGTCAGALCGTSTITSYIESASGVAAGARTGLAPIVTGCCFLLALFAAPLVQLAGQDVGPMIYGVDPNSVHVAMYPAVAPALIVVGFFMMRPLRLVAWDDITEALPAFLTVAMMAFTYAIHNGIAIGCIAYVAIKLLAGKPREVHPALVVIAILLVLRFALL